MSMSERVAVLKAQWSTCCLLLERMGQEELEEATEVLVRVTLGQEELEEVLVRETTAHMGVDKFLVGLGQALASQVTGVQEETEQTELSRDDWQTGMNKNVQSSPDDLASFDAHHLSETVTKSYNNVTKSICESPCKSTLNETTGQIKEKPSFYLISCDGCNFKSSSRKAYNSHFQPAHRKQNTYCCLNCSDKFAS